MTKKITLDLGDKSYEIVVANQSVNQLSEFLIAKNYSKIVVISDQNVFALHFSKIVAVLRGVYGSDDLIAQKLVNIKIVPGESSKSFAVLEEICEQILQQNIDRKSLIIAFGGGVVGDLAGFVASILLRGVDFIQVPTTLLAMVDSSVGGKTAINSKFGKNLLGSFYQPKLVICDLQFLNSLPSREFLAGYAEVIKYGLIADEFFFDFLCKNHDQIFAKNFVDAEKFIRQIIARSCEIKAEIVGRDEKESGERALLNFGHNFGHIFETETGYSDEILHGEAVALGMAMEAEMSHNLGLIDSSCYQQIISYLQKCGFVLDVKKIRASWSKDNLIQHLFKDKKIENGNLTFILLTKIGAAKIVKNVALSDCKKVLWSKLDNDF